MVFPFSKKAPKEEAETAGPPAPRYVPTDRVQRLASQGMSEPEIISRLRREGFTPSQINDALNSALKREVAGPPREMGLRPPGPMQRPAEAPRGPPRQAPIPPAAPPQPLGMAPRQEQMPAQMPPAGGQPPAFARAPAQQVAMPPRGGQIPGAPAPPPQQREVPRFRPPERVVAPGMAVPRPYREAPSEEQMFTYERGPEVEELGIGGEITLEEVVEGIVSDKWQEFEERLGNFEKRDIQLQGQIEDMRKKLTVLEKSLQEREGTFVGKLDNFGDSMENIEGRIGSIETLFKNFIPELTENIRTMSDMVEKVKGKEEK